MQVAKLTATTRGEERAVALRPDEGLTMGRDRGCDVTLRDTKVSRRHCQLSFSQGQVVVVDLGSSHGIQHRGVRKPLLALAVGDGFHIGDTFVRFVGVVDADDAMVAAWFGPGGPHERLGAPAGEPANAAAAADDYADGGDDGELLVDDVPAAAPAPSGSASAEAPPALSVADIRPAPVFADEANAPPPRQGWDAFVPPAQQRGAVLLGEPVRRAEEPRARPAAATGSIAIKARLAAEAVVFSMHMALCVALLVGLKLAVGFDLYALFGLG